MAFQNQTLGTIISSVLNYDQLNDYIHEARGCHANSSYAPCDGRSVAGSALAPILQQNTGATKVPDLRGKFVRGLNIFHVEGQDPFDAAKSDPDGLNRKPGDYQGDEVKKHGHTAHSSGPFAHFGGPGMGLQSDEKQEFTFPNPTITIDDYNGPESRPRNISVFYYIKIN